MRNFYKPSVTSDNDEILLLILWFLIDVFVLSIPRAFVIFMNSSVTLQISAVCCRERGPAMNLRLDGEGGGGV